MLQKKWRNLVSAISALGYMWHEELSFRIQVFGGLATFALAYFLHISTVEWLLVILMTGAILSTEAINTAIEETCDALISKHHPQVGRIKDLGALASALIGFAAFVIGLIIFVPKIAAFI